MSFKKFEKNDLFINTIKAKPHFQFKIYGGKSYINSEFDILKLNNLYMSPEIIIPPPPYSCNLNYDFSCEENTQYLPTI